MFQVHYQNHRPLTTAHLAQTMTLLSLPVEELKQQVESELSSNPALEIIEEIRCPVCQRKLNRGEICPVCSRPKAEAPEEPVVFISPRDDFYPVSGSSGAEMPEDNVISSKEDLATFVLRQVASDLEPENRKIAAYLLTHLDDDGLLTTTLYDAARYLHVSISKIQEVQRIIQRAEPYGVGSCSPQEALLAQLGILDESYNVPELAFRIVQEGMVALTHRHYSELAKQFNTTMNNVQKVVRFIVDNLNPYPARSHWGDNRQPTVSELQVYHQPDILIYHLNDDPSNPLAVEIILPVSGTLRVNPLFRQAVQQADTEKKELWKRDIESASLLVKCLQQRNHTMLRLMQKITSMQKDYIIMGEKYLKPLTRVHISQQLGVHESTISRAVSGKTVQLPNRKIVPLSSFFDRNLNVRKTLRELIEQEEHPLSDNDLVELLAANGFNVARRTVAKYRSMEGILPAHLRRTVYKTT